jgi:hypothetical protein
VSVQPKIKRSRCPLLTNSTNLISRQLLLSPLYHPKIRGHSNRSALSQLMCRSGRKRMRMIMRIEAVQDFQYGNTRRIVTGTYLCSDVSKGCSCYLCHTVNTSIARSGCFDLFFDRTWGGKGMLVSLGRVSGARRERSRLKISTQTRSLLRNSPSQGSSALYL